MLQKAFQERIVEIEMKKLRIALVEIGGSHDECLLTQMHAIQNRGHEMVLITTTDVANRNPIFDKYVSETLLVDVESVSRKAIARQVSNKLKQAEVQKAIFNTAQGKVIRRICVKALFHSIEFIGVVHTTRMFTESFTQKIIHWKIKKYLMPSENLSSKVILPKGVSVDYFYPLRFPSTALRESNHKRTIAIIGGVEERRKDLDGFLNMLATLKGENVHFVFLGKSDASKPDVSSFLSRLKSENLTDLVTTFGQFVSQDSFNSTVQSADLILPLVHPNTPSADQYFRNQISGAMIVSFGYKVPLLLHSGYRDIEEMKPAAFYYDLESFKETLLSALNNSEGKRGEMERHLAYTNAEQERRYSDFLEL